RLESTKSNGPWKDIVGIGQLNDVICRLSKEGWKMCVGVKDQMAWTFSEDEQYTTASFMAAVTALELGSPTTRLIFYNVWHGLVPLEMLMWFILTGPKNKGCAVKEKCHRTR
ncbi:hypothetical protein PIB30_100764, partial [Stylosanthes scabra]|nr:hypothetical protein [Stylosanthes scabra]